MEQEKNRAGLHLGFGSLGLTWLTALSIWMADHAARVLQTRVGLALPLPTRVLLWIDASLWAVPGAVLCTVVLGVIFLRVRGNRRIAFIALYTLLVGLVLAMAVVALVLPAQGYDLVAGTPR